MLYSRSTSADTAFRALSSDGLKTESQIRYTPKGSIDGPVVSSVAMALFCDFLLLTLCIPILPELFKDTQFSGFETSLVFASKPFFQFFANPVMGAYVERHGPRAPLLIGVLILSISTVVFAFGTSLTSDIELAYATVMVARSVQGIASASIMSSGMTLCAMTHSEEIRGSAMGLAFTGVALGTLLGPPVGGIIGYYVNLWTPFAIVSGILMIVYITMRVLFAGMPSEGSTGEGVLNKGLLSTPSTDQLPGSDISSLTGTTADGTPGVIVLLKDPVVSYVGCLAVLGNATIGLIEPLVPPWLDDEFGQNLLWQGIIFGSASLSYLIFTPIAGFVSDTYPKRVCLCIGFIACALGLCTFSAAVGVPQACLSLALIGAGIAFVDTPILPLLAVIVENRQKRSALRAELLSIESVNSMPSGGDKHPPAELGYIYALNDMFLCIGFTVGPLLGSGMASGFGGGSSGFKNATLCFGLLTAIIAPTTLVVLKLIEPPRVSPENANSNQPSNKHPDDNLGSDF